MIKNVAIVAGGDTSEWEVSLRSAEGIKNFLSGTPYELYEVIVRGSHWYCEKDGKQYDVDKNDFSILMGKNKIKFDFAYIIIHGHPGEDGCLQGYLEMMNIPYSTCDVLTSSLTYNKYACKEFLKSKEICLAKSVLISGEDTGTERIKREVGFPCFVKPNVGGSSFGVTKVKEEKDLQEAIQTAKKECEEVLVEEYIAGTEISCGFCRIGEKIDVFPILEIVSETEFFDYEAKYNGKSQEIIPARISNNLTERVKELTKNVALWMNLKYIARVDYIIKGEDIYLLEVNTTPGMTAASIIPKQIKAFGKEVKEYLVAIIEDASKRKNA
ncbi:MAG TPA: D-alanine--D-alanine ligase [Porphyromonadaceae bacterium]|nr:D-alanine--D-alanine ligase [Porphyromonadaceae bacterium]